MEIEQREKAFTDKKVKLKINKCRNIQRKIKVKYKSILISYSSLNNIYANVQKYLITLDSYRVLKLGYLI